MRAARRATLLAVVAALPLAACTTTVAGQGRPLGAQPTASSPGASGPGASGTPTPTSSASDPNGLPSGAPSPVETTYANSPPIVRSYLYARDATYAASVVTVTGAYTATGPTTQVDGAFGFDSAKGVTVGQCALTAGGAAAQVRGVGESTYANAPAAFWTAYGVASAGATQASGRWVALTQTVTGVAACNNKVFFLSQFEPQDADDLTTDVDGGDYVITDRTSGVATAIDRDSGRIVGIRTQGGELRLGYPDAPLTVTAPAGAVRVPGI